MRVNLNLVLILKMINQISNNRSDISRKVYNETMKMAIGKRVVYINDRGIISVDVYASDYEDIGRVQILSKERQIQVFNRKTGKFAQLLKREYQDKLGLNFEIKSYY